MKQLFYILTAVLLLSACSSIEKNKQQTTSNSYVTVIINSELGSSIKAGSSQQYIYLYNTEEKTKGCDTIQLKVAPMDLLTVGYPYFYGEMFKDTLCVIPNDTIIAKITTQKIFTAVIRKGKQINAQWKASKLLPKNKDYAIIKEMYQLRNRIGFPPPFSMWGAPEIVKKEAEIAYKKWQTEKKDKTVKDTIKKYADKYLKGIQNYYANRLKAVNKEPNILKRNFYKSYILFQEYKDLQTLQNIVKKQAYYPVLKNCYNKQIAINGAFAKQVAQRYIHSNISFNRDRNILLTTLYDSIIPADFKQYEETLKQITLSNMIFKKYPRKEIMAYVDKFVAQYGTNNKIEEIKTTIEYDQQITNDLNLVATNGTKITFKQLRKKHKGKVLYIDFWASWCNPCRLMLPESAKLHKELNSKDIVFIYLGFRDKEKAWQIACKKENLYQNSFRVVNSKTSTFIKKMKIGSIPRYMLYDKSGRLYQKMLLVLTQRRFEEY